MGYCGVVNRLPSRALVFTKVTIENHECVQFLSLLGTNSRVCGICWAGRDFGEICNESRPLHNSGEKANQALYLVHRGWHECVGGGRL